MGTTWRNHGREYAGLSIVKSDISIAFVETFIAACIDRENLEICQYKSYCHLHILKNFQTDATSGPGPAAPEKKGAAGAAPRIGMIACQCPPPPMKA
jgi:hypothetical protein